MTTLNTIIEDEKKRSRTESSIELRDDGIAYEAPTMYRLTEQEFTTAMQRAYEAGRAEERVLIHDAFINEFAGAGELWFPYVSKYDPYTTKEDTVLVAEEYWENIIDSLTPTKTDKQIEDRPPRIAQAGEPLV